MAYDSPFHSIIIFESLSCDGDEDNEESQDYSVRVYVSLVIIYVFKKSSSDINHMENDYDFVFVPQDRNLNQ